MMVKDVEACRTWVSDKTLESLASALKTDIYRLLMPDTAYEGEINKAIRNDLESIAAKIRQDICNPQKRPQFVGIGYFV